MKLVVLLAFVALTSAEKLPSEEPQAVVPSKPHVMAILRDVRVYPDSVGSHTLDFETENGIVIKTSGSEGPLGGSNMQGSYSYVLEDGSQAVVNFIADEGGYRAESPLLPVAPLPLHPMPQHALDQIAFAEEQKRLEAEAAENKVAA